MYSWIYLVLTTALLASSCSQNRAIEPKINPIENRFAKENFASESPWLFQATIINHSELGGQFFIGQSSSLKAGFFDFDRDKMYFRSATSVYGKETETNTLPELINSWSIQHSEYHLGESNGKVTNNETENNKIPWQEKSHVQVNLERHDIDLGSMFRGWNNGCWSAVSSAMKQSAPKFEENAFNYVVEYSFTSKPGASYRCKSIIKSLTGSNSFSLLVRYSYLKTPQTDYKPYVYNGTRDPLQNKYGFFTTSFYSKNEANKNQVDLMMARFAPNKTHTFYFAPDFPQEWKWMYTDPDTGIIARTNSIMRKHGLQTKFEVKDSDGSQVIGDIRYSMIKAVNESNPAAPGGYGPSVVNPFTGEKISATSYLYLSSYVSAVDSSIKKRLATDSQIENTPTFKGMSELMGTSMSEWNKNTASLVANRTNRDIFTSIMQEQYTPVYFNYSDPSMKPNAVLKEVSSLKELEDNEFFSEDLQAHVKVVVEQEQNSNLADLEMSQDNDHTVYSMDYLAPIAQEMFDEGRDKEDILKTMVYRTAIHEFGHNLGLQHNFYGSVDANNFSEPKVYTDSKGVQRKAGQNSSSVMEYLFGIDEVYAHMNWESYDEAALVYAYSSGEKDLSTREGRSHLEDQNPKTFMFCTHRHMYNNAMCNMYDRGTSPSEIVISMARYYELLASSIYNRDGRELWSSGSTLARVLRKLDKFIALEQDGFSSADMARALSNRSYSNDDIVRASTAIKNDLRQAIKLIIATYGSIIITKDSDRPFADEYDEQFGNQESRGIFDDKIISVLKLFGESASNLTAGSSLIRSFYSYANTEEYPEVSQVFYKTLEKTLVDRVDAYAGFDESMRIFYTEMSNDNLQAERNATIRDSFDSQCYSTESFASSFTIAAPAAFNKATIDDQNLAFNYNSRIWVVNKDQNFLAYKLLDNASSSSLRSTIQQLVELKNVKASVESTSNVQCL